MSVSRTLINTSTQHRHFTKPPHETIIFAFTFMFEMHLESICFSRINIAPSGFATICCKNIIQVIFCPISQLRCARFRGGPETDVRDLWHIQFFVIYLLLMKPQLGSDELTSLESHMPLPQVDLGILCLPHRSTLLFFCHNELSKLRQPISHMVDLVKQGSCILAAVSQSILLL